MYINKGKRDILIFPKFKNINKIQELRNKYDPLANLIAPHITIVFLFSDNVSIFKFYIIFSSNFLAFLQVEHLEYSINIFFIFYSLRTKHVNSTANK